MASVKIVKTVIQIRRDTEANWLINKDIIPAAGEPCLTLDGEFAGQVKYGDGVQTWEQLKYSGVANIEGDGKTIAVSNGIASLIGSETASAGQSFRISADGTGLEWYTPSATEEIVQVQESITNLETNVTSLQEIVNNNSTTVTNLQEIVAGKANAADVYTKAEIDSMVSGAFHYCGTVADMDELAALEAPKQGDVYQVTAEGGFKIYDGDSWEDFGNGIDLSGYMTAEQAKAMLMQVEYEIFDKPAATLVDYRDKEIRVMIPSDHQFELRESGENSGSSTYYIGFKAYAPSADIVSFKEDLAEIIADETMYYFENNSFAGVDKYGRKYSIVWLPVAKYNEDGSWTYYGASSTSGKYIGWYYSVDWYNADGKIVGSDCIRINLSNEACHDELEPFYMGNVLEGIQVGDTVMEVVNKKASIPVASEGALGVVKSSDADNGVSVKEDGTLEVNSLSFSKIVQEEGDTIILDGGGAA